MERKKTQCLAKTPGRQELALAVTPPLRSFSGFVRRNRGWIPAQDLIERLVHFGHDVETVEDIFTIIGEEIASKIVFVCCA